MKPTTLDAIRMHRSDPDAIVAAGELVDMRFVAGGSLSLRAAKLFCLLVQEAGIDVAEPKQHRIPYAVLNDTFHRSRDDLVEAIMELHSTVVSVKLVSRKGRTFVKSGPLLSDVERDEDDDQDGAEVRFEFSPALRRVIADSTHWASVSRRAVLAFESKFSLRLYLFLSLRANLRKVSEELTLEELRAILGISGTAFSRWQDMRRFVLDRAIAEISHLAGFYAAYEPVKRGKRIVGVTLIWGLKDRAGLIEAQRELDRPRVGRIARREELVESIAAERQKIAESLAAAPPMSRPRPAHTGHPEPAKLPAVGRTRH